MLRFSQCFCKLDVLRQAVSSLTDALEIAPFIPGPDHSVHIHGALTSCQPELRKILLMPRIKQVGYKV